MKTISNFLAGDEGYVLPPWLCIGLWILLGVSMILFNKALLSTWDFSYPFFLTSWHCLLATVLTQIMSRTTDYLPGVKQGKVTPYIYITRIFPISIFFAAGLVCGNSAYQYLSVAYIQMLKSSAPVLTLLLAFFTGREGPSFLKLGVVIVISLGVGMASVGEKRFSLIGFILQITSTFTDVCRMTTIDLVLADLKLDSLSLLYYIMPPSLFLISIGFFYLEYNDLKYEIGELSAVFCWLLLANGFLAFALNCIVVLILKTTSAVTLSLAGIFRDIILVSSSVVIFNSPITSLQIIGYSIALAGLNIYKEYKRDPESIKTFLLYIYNTLINTFISKSNNRTIHNNNDSINGQGTDDLELETLVTKS